jgi:stage II sporulation protein M
LFSKIHETLIRHVKDNSHRYFMLLIAFTIGISAGAFTVNGLSAIQRDELINYFQGFLSLLDKQNIDTNELLKQALLDNGKTVLALWLLGLTIIGIPFIFVLISIRGFITGFTSGFVIQVLGIKGVLFTLFALIPKEIVIIPCIIALGVNGMNFSLNIIKNKSIKHLSKESLKSSVFSYCFVTVFFSCLIFFGVLIETYITPVFIRVMTPFISN